MLELFIKNFMMEQITERTFDPGLPITLDTPDELITFLPQVNSQVESLTFEFQKVGVLNGQDLLANILYHMKGKRGITLMPHFENPRHWTVEFTKSFSGRMAIRREL